MSIEDQERVRAERAVAAAWRGLCEAVDALDFAVGSAVGRHGVTWARVSELLGGAWSRSAAHRQWEEFADLAALPGDVLHDLPLPHADRLWRFDEELAAADPAVLAAVREQVRSALRSA